MALLDAISLYLEVWPLVRVLEATCRDRLSISHLTESLLNEHASWPEEELSKSIPEHVSNSSDDAAQRWMIASTRKITNNKSFKAFASLCVRQAKSLAPDNLSYDLKVNENADCLQGSVVVSHEQVSGSRVSFERTFLSGYLISDDLFLLLCSRVHGTWSLRVEL